MPRTIGEMQTDRDPDTIFRMDTKPLFSLKILRTGILIRAHFARQINSRQIAGIRVGGN